tara:strand:- start:206532 stop:207533 length:1002 start_codon:yes stop_codon:yes gene_type:complete
MQFNGVKNKNKFFFILACFLLMFSSFSKDGGVEVPGQLQIDTYAGDTPDKDSYQNNHIFNSPIEEYIGKDGADASSKGHLIDTSETLDDKVLSDKEKILDKGVTVPFSFDKSQNYLSISHTDSFKNLYDKGDAVISFSYLKDDFTVADPDGIYNKTFETGSQSLRAGYLLFASDNYFYKDWVNLYWSAGVGLSYSKGKGVFLSSQQSSNATFSLYTAPLDLGLGLELPLGKVLNLSVVGGPSAMLLYQNRSDMDQGDALKRKRQFSPGYYVTGKMRVSLGNLFRKSAFGYFSKDKITNYYLNLEMRQHSYGSFQDPLEISGSSYGIGFSFDYL